MFYKLIDYILLKWFKNKSKNLFLLSGQENVDL